MASLLEVSKQSFADFAVLHQDCQKEKEIPLLPNPDNYALLEKQIAQKQKDATPVVMVYGVYNAGKSTLINALLGKEVAETGDTPLTNTVTSYTWKNFNLIDSPGIDSPRSCDTQLAEDKLQKSDAVIFVVNPLGVAEEKATLDKLLDLLISGKKIFLVYNLKTVLSEEALIKIKDKTLQILQSEIKARGFNVGDLLNKIPMLKINLRTACKASFGDFSEEKKAILKSKCGLAELENSLYTFLNSIKPDDGVLRVINETIHYLDVVEKNGTQQGSSENLKVIQNLQQDAFKRIDSCSATLNASLTRNSDEIANKVRRYIIMNVKNSDNEALQSAVEKIVQEGFESFSNEVSSLIEGVSEYLSNAIEDYNCNFNKPQAYGVNARVSLDDSNISLVQQSQSFGFAQGLKATELGIGAISKVITPDLIVSGLKEIKILFPSLMTGIGKVTMGKWAETLVTKVLPGVGTVLSVVSTLYTIFGTSKEEEEMERQARAQREAMERFNAQVENCADQIRSNFVSTFEQFFKENVDPKFNEVRQNITQMVELRDSKQNLVLELTSRASRIKSALEQIKESSDTLEGGF